MIHIEHFTWRQDGHEHAAAWMALKCDDCGALGPRRVCNGLSESSWDAVCVKAALPLGWTEKIRPRSNLVALCPKCAGYAPTGQLTLGLTGGAT